MIILNILSDFASTVLCFLSISHDCISSADQHIDLFQWTANGRILLPSNYSTLNNESSAHFVVHGWTENSFGTSETIARNYYEMNPNANIILVDYGRMSNESYAKAKTIVNIAGTLLGDRIVDMIKHEALQLKKIQIYAHSLGTHISGKAARVVKEKMGDRIARISATDPPGPLFNLQIAIPLSESLSKDDADMLDITHTSATLGTVQAFGTVDTYVGTLGVDQPACRTPDFENGAEDVLVCDHKMARWYFAESILSCGFIQTNITRIVYGQHMPLNAKGMYSMPVNAEPPFAKEVNTYPDCYTGE